MKHYSIKTKKTPQKIRTLFTVLRGLPSDNVTRLSFCKDVLYAGTDKGLAYFKDGEFRAVEGIAEEVKQYKSQKS